MSATNAARPVNGHRPSPFRTRRGRPTAERGAFFNEDCIEGARRLLRDDSIDLIVTDPPYGIDGDTLDRHYNRKEEHVLEGYVEVPRHEYAAFSNRWIAEAARILRPGGSLYVVSGYTNLYDILSALRATELREVNHIIWKYNFGVFTRRKYVSSHYHILFYEKPGERRTFNRLSRHGVTEKDANGGSLLYQDLEDVWSIKREYKPGRIKNKNELPTALLAKILQYSSDPGDLVCDLFLGSFSTAKIARGMNRAPIGFEINRRAFEHQVAEVEAIEPGHLLDDLPQGRDDVPRRRGASWTATELDRLAARYGQLRREGRTKGEATTLLGDEFERGRFSIANALKKRGL